MNSMPLHFAAIGDTHTILRIGGTTAVKKHLESLGFVPGGSVCVVSALGGGLIVNVKASRVAISREMAQKIFIQ